MKKKIKKTIKLISEQLDMVHDLQKTTKKKGTLADLDKNEIEFKAQLNVLEHLLFDKKSKKKK
jgi:hypothetical protein